MRAMIVERLGNDPEAAHPADVDLPEPAEGEALIRVQAAGVGPWDVLMRRGAWTGPMPYIPGGEFAGVIVGDTGADAAFDDGAPVYGYPGLSGCYAEYVTCPIEQLAPIPAGLSIVDAAAAPIDALTAEQGLTDVLAVGAGDHVLITAAAGENDEFLAVHDVDAIAPIIAIHRVVGDGRAAHCASPGEWDVAKPVIVPRRNTRVSHSNSPSDGSGIVVGFVRTAGCRPASGSFGPFGFPRRLRVCAHRLGGAEREGFRRNVRVAAMLFDERVKIRLDAEDAAAENPLDRGQIVAPQFGEDQVRRA